MAAVADSANRLFNSAHRAGDYIEQHSKSRRPSSSRPGSKSQEERAQDVAQGQTSMSHTTAGIGSREGSQQAADSNTAGSNGRLANTTDEESASRTGVASASMASDSKHNTDTPSSPVQQAQVPTAPSTPQRIQIRDLAHIREIATDRARRERGARAGARRDAQVQYEISSMPIENVIEMVAGLLTQITTTNDLQHEHLHRQMPLPDSSASISPQTSSVLAFHGKNVPSITILSYLNRINKYCPTSFDVFLSLLVFFDRMTERVNAGPMQSMREQNHQQHSAQAASRVSSDVEMKDAKMPETAQTPTPPASGRLGGQEHDGPVPGTPHSRHHEPPATASGAEMAPELNLSHFFVVDSFNIHRLVIAGVTCASKFFSDVFYTNSRYAKVGGLPLPELNHLELQFLMLNDFRLSSTVEELEAYGTMLVEFYARQVVEQEREAAEHTRSQSAV